MAEKQTVCKEPSKHSTEIEVTLLRYEVYSWSSFSSGYHPRLIQEDRPNEQSSRWLSETIRPPQYITLKLLQPAIVTAVVFNKFHRPHACNVRKIRIHGGMTEDIMTCLCEGELCNDGLKESLNVRHDVNGGTGSTTVGGGNFPCRFIKLEPLDTWGQTNYSLWCVQLMGTTNKQLVDMATARLKEYQQKEALRLCMKHLRQYDYQEAYHALCKQAHLDLEDPILTELHTALVDRGDHSKAEEILCIAAADGLLDTYLQSRPRTAMWYKINETTDIAWPSMRGGHQLCVDSINQVLYMFGGWDGGQDLADLWTYDIEKKKWVCLCSDASIEGGPSPRSCHKMCIDAEKQILYILGKYLDQDTRTSLFTITVPGDFYSYHISTNTWSIISEDTFSDSGPRLLFDHQMCYNPRDQCIYVYGGKVITSLLQEGIGTTIFSGLYRYNTIDKNWTCLKPDYTGGTYPHNPVPRMAHVMLLHVDNQDLYVIGGQRDKQPLSDMWIYNIPGGTVVSVADGKTLQTPTAGFTTRATLEPNNGEIFLHLGMSHNNSNNDNSSNSLWVYSINDKQWSLISSSSPLPCARFAHQLVYDPIKQTNYMFGGNPGKGHTNIQTRLEDLWSMKVEQQSREKLLHHSIFEIRKQKYLELVYVDGAEALRYLKTSLAECVNHNNHQQSTEFRQLATELFTTNNNNPQHNNDTSLIIRETRSHMFDILSSYFPEEQSQPRNNIISLVKY